MSEWEEEREEIKFAYIDKIPVNMICLEKCDGLFDELLENNLVDETLGASALFQIVAALIVYQRDFKMTHNDLHTNNIMFVNTDLEFLEYTFYGVQYKVPFISFAVKLVAWYLVVNS